MRPAKKEYEYGVDQCSVGDKALLTKFRKKRSKWMDWLERDVHHNIWGQIHSLMWNDAAYRSLNEARRFASEENPTAAVNCMFGEFIDRGYVSTQVLDICKITDRSNNDPKKGVISLPRLLDDIAEAQRIVIRIATTIGSHILYDTALGGVVPTAQFNVFENLEMPVIPAANMEEIGDWWHRHASERENWLQERIDLITGQITPILEGA